jgi:hypothetical protein
MSDRSPKSFETARLQSNRSTPHHSVQCITDGHGAGAAQILLNGGWEVDIRVLLPAGRHAAKCDRDRGRATAEVSIGRSLAEDRQQRTDGAERHPEDGCRVA